ncbi:TPA: fimbrial protein, partial [Escherichia coli]
MNKVTKTAIAGLLALFAGNAAATDGEIVFDGEILKSACEINDSDKKIEVALGHWICPYISRHLLSLNPLLA